MRSSKSFDFVDVPLSSSSLPGDPAQQTSKFYIRKKFRWILAITVVSILVVSLIISLAVESKKNGDLKSKLQMLQRSQLPNIPMTSTPQPISNIHTTVVPSDISWPIKIGNLSLDKNLSFYLGNESTELTSWKSIFPDSSMLALTNCTTDIKTHLCLRWKNERMLNISLTQQGSESDSSLDCYTINWEGLKDSRQEITDCFNVSTTHWYGGYEDTYQYWPFEKNVMPASPFVSNDAFKGGIGNVLGRYFISANGVGISLHDDIPLYFSLNNPINGSMCFTAKYERYPYFNLNNMLPKLSYKLCHAENVRDIHTKMSSMLMKKPNGIPNESLFRYPIWSTWAQYHYDINQSTVVKFTNEILDNGFNCSQIEIDDDWTPHYGDNFFDSRKFPNATDMIAIIKRNGCAVTAWVHPFFNTDGSYFKEAMDKKYLLRRLGSDFPALSSWWDGNMTGVLDVSNENATDWYLGKLHDLQTETGLDSFKFDAGEQTWLPKIYSGSNLPENPNCNYPQKYVQMAFRADPSRRQEVRSAYGTQEFPIFVRQIDKISAWGHNNALSTIIPSVFTLGILGYPFILPDMIGGNAYEGRFPDPELFVRWLQLNTFLPSMQFSIVPWDERFNNSDIDVLTISKKFANLHANISDVLIKYANMSASTGQPIIRPLWWIDPYDEIALTCEDEFLVGDEYLVAPVITKDARSRDIYLPSGLWIDMLKANETSVRKGPVLIYNYTVEIDELAYFKKTKQL